MLIFHNLIRDTWLCSVRVCCWHVMPKFTSNYQDQWVLRWTSHRIQLMMKRSLPFCPKCHLKCAKAFYYESLFIFASSLNHIMFQFLINPQGFNCFSHFFNGCMLIRIRNKQFHKCVKCSVWLLLISHQGLTNILYMNNIGITTKLYVWPSVHCNRRSLWNFGLPRYG